MLLAQLTGNEVAAAVAEEEAHGLNDGHQGKDYTHGTGGAGVFQHTHKKRVRHIVKGGDQHTDDAWSRQTADQTAHRRFRHLVEFLRLFFIHETHLSQLYLFLTKL